AHVVVDLADAALGLGADVDVLPAPERADHLDRALDGTVDDRRHGHRHGPRCGRRGRLGGALGPGMAAPGEHRGDDAAAPERWHPPRIGHGYAARPGPAGIAKPRRRSPTRRSASPGPRSPFL